MVHVYAQVTTRSTALWSIIVDGTVERTDHFQLFVIIAHQCTRQSLPSMRGEPKPIITEKDAKPVAFPTPIKVPLHWSDQVKKDLDRDIPLGIREPVLINTPTTWCASMVVVAKHDQSSARFHVKMQTKQTGRPSIGLLRSRLLVCRVPNNCECHTSTKLWHGWWGDDV